MTSEEMNWFLRGGKRPEPTTTDDQAEECPDPAVEFVMEKLASHRARPKVDAPVTCQNCGGDNLADEEQCTHCGAPLQSDITAADPDQKTYLVKVSQVKKCLWEGYVEVVADFRLEALAKARDEFENCELDTWDLVDPELDSENDEEPVFSIEPEA